MPTETATMADFDLRAMSAYQDTVSKKTGSGWGEIFLGGRLQLSEQS